MAISSRSRSQQRSQDGVIFLMEGVLATDLRDTVGIVPRIPPSSFSPFSLLALLPSFTLDILSLPYYISRTIFENVPWKFRDVGIFRRFTIASEREYHFIISDLWQALDAPWKFRTGVGIQWTCYQNFHDWNIVSEIQGYFGVKFFPK